MNRQEQNPEIFLSRNKIGESECKITLREITRREGRVCDIPGSSGPSPGSLCELGPFCEQAFGASCPCPSPSSFSSSREPGIGASLRISLPPCILCPDVLFSFELLPDWLVQAFESGEQTAGSDATSQPFTGRWPCQVDRPQKDRFPALPSALVYLSMSLTNLVTAVDPVATIRMLDKPEITFHNQSSLGLDVEKKWPVVSREWH